MEDFDTLLNRLEEESERPCADLRHPAALRGAARALRAINDISEHVMQSLVHLHEPTGCPSPEHVRLLRETAQMLELSLQMIPDGLRYLAATTPDAAEAIRSKRMRKLKDIMAENWRKGQPS